MSEHTEPQHFVSNLYNVLLWNFSVFREPTSYDFLEWNSSGRYCSKFVEEAITLSNLI